MGIVTWKQRRKDTGENMSLWMLIIWCLQTVLPWIGSVKLVKYVLFFNASYVLRVISIIFGNTFRLWFSYMCINLQYSSLPFIWRKNIIQVPFKVPFKSTRVYTSGFLLFCEAVSACSHVLVSAYLAEFIFWHMGQLNADSCHFFSLHSKERFPTSTRKWGKTKDILSKRKNTIWNNNKIGL